jgi:hypothetical protein
MPLHREFTETIGDIPREAPVKDFKKETDARIVIDDLLRQAGWDPADKSQVMTEFTVYGADRFTPRNWVMQN